MLRLCCAVSISQVSQIPAAHARTADLALRLREAAARGAAVNLPAGEISLMGLDLPDGTILKGVPGRTVLKLAGLGPLLSASMAKRITLESLILEGAEAFIPREKGLLDFADVIDLAIRDCVIRRSTARGVNLLRCGGVFAGNTIETVADSGFHSLDGLGIDVDDNLVRKCGDNGVVVFTTTAGRYEGSRIRNNRIEDILNRSGGNGPFGNGVLIWGAGAVRVAHNRISRCAYTAVRNNSGHGVEVIGNDCRTFGEKAMYAEFGAKNAVFRDNRIEDAGAGIAVANSDKGTDGAVISGNVIIGMRESHPDSDFGPDMLWLTGILAEKNADIVGNRIVGPGWIGVALGGWRENLRAEANDIAGVDYGVVFATGEGAGDALIARNRIRARKGAIVATAGTEFLPGDLAAPGARKYPRLTVRDNETT
ncbi:TIGR03808 family TAT-translocated repetitive protein [Methylocystis sp. ATCC 49242]|uniref:TIGR03808 family TAT-translocated repetitive protein n=1 Tax=Methylocystis sp. ATCC 49242 TaxID=622637 RepID=UPI00055A14B8|nr:TIGR03808 family TAT-translocated repetitive protein [Methylocystis sp. ATCC 49242]